METSLREQWVEAHRKTDKEYEDGIHKCNEKDCPLCDIAGKVNIIAGCNKCSQRGFENLERITDITV